MTAIIDLTGGEVKVLGNAGDSHTFRLSNPVGEDIIVSGGEYEIEFELSIGGRTLLADEDIDLSQLDDGLLLFTLTIAAGTYRVRRLNPRRTVLTIEVELK